MNFKVVGVIARKEFKDVLRDRRTLVFMMLLPIVVMPLLMLGLFKFMARQAEAREKQVVTIAASSMDEITLRALQDVWYDSNSTVLSVILAKLGVESLGGLSDMGALLARVDVFENSEEPEVEADDDGSADTAAIEEEAQQAGMIAAGVAAMRDLTSEQSQLIKDARVIQNLLKNTEFVRFDELSGEGELAPGVEVPLELPGRLSELAVTLAVQSKEIDAAIYIPNDALVTLGEVPQAVTYRALVEDGSGERFENGDFTLLSRAPDLETVDIHLVYDSSIGNSEEAYDRVTAFVSALNRFVNVLRIDAAELPREFGRPIAVERANVATQSRRIQAALGGILPYLLFAFCFFGALYPALDVTAGEKERFTLETLLLSPVTRLEIATGKFVVVFVAAIIAAVLTTTSMILTFAQGLLPADVMASLDLEFQPLALLLTGSLVIPVAALYSASLLAVGLYARSFKEAQSYTVPLQFLFVLPTVVSLLPDIEPDSYLAWVPFVNISLLMKELLKGNYLWSFYGITLASTLLLTAIALFVASRLFSRESVLLRT
jgi:ABC-type Na+ efflux pump permease subunit